MPSKVRVTRNREANELSAHIQSDAAMMAALRTAIQSFHEQYRAEFAAADRSSWDPSPLLIPPTTDLIIALIERKVAILRAFPSQLRTELKLESLSKKASLYPVADDVLQLCLPEYRPMAQTGRFELVDQSVKSQKPWWRFW